jgi:hypothetical protein
VVAKDDENALRLNCGECGFSDTGVKIAFPTYRDRKSGEPVIWRVLLQAAGARVEAAQRLLWTVKESDVSSRLVELGT